MSATQNMECQIMDEKEKSQEAIMKEGKTRDKFKEFWNDSCSAEDQNCQENASGSKENEVGVVVLFGVPIVSLHADGKERLCLAQISNTLLRDFSYNEIHNRRVALGISCLQCTPMQLEILRRTGAMPISSRRCGLITKREAERLVKSFLQESSPPRLPSNFSFKVQHNCGWGCKGYFVPSRYNSSRAKCLKCEFCNSFFSPNKFIFHFHRNASSVYRHADAANFNSWRKHLHLSEPLPKENIVHAWEDVKAMFNGGSRKRMMNVSNKHLSKDACIDLQMGNFSRQFSPVVSSYNIQNSFMGNQGQSSPALLNAHPAFPKPFQGQYSTTYGDFLRSLSAPYTMWWLKYAPMTPNYAINNLDVLQPESASVAAVADWSAKKGFGLDGNLRDSEKHSDGASSKSSSETSAVSPREEASGHDVQDSNKTANDSIINVEDSWTEELDCPMKESQTNVLDIENADAPRKSPSRPAPAGGKVDDGKASECDDHPSEGSQVQSKDGERDRCPVIQVEGRIPTIKNVSNSDPPDENMHKGLALNAATYVNCCALKADVHKRSKVMVAKCSLFV